MKITGSQVRADDGGWLNTSHRKRFRNLFVAAAEHFHEEGQYLRTTFLVACSEQRNRITARTPYSAGDYYFRQVYGLTTSSELTSAMCRDRWGY